MPFLFLLVACMIPLFFECAPPVLLLGHFFTVLLLWSLSPLLPRLPIFHGLLVRYLFLLVPYLCPQDCILLMLADAWVVPFVLESDYSGFGCFIDCIPHLFPLMLLLLDHPVGFQIYFFWLLGCVLIFFSTSYYVCFLIPP